MSTPSPASPGHVFFSYVREDSAVADELISLLEAEGLTVWLDRTSIPVGTRWKRTIETALRESAVAVMCFSENGESKRSNGQNEELNLASIELRRRRPEDLWLFNVRFDESNIPSYDIGSGDYLGAIQFADFFGADKIKNGQELAKAIARRVDELHQLDTARATRLAAASAGIDSTATVGALSVRPAESTTTLTATPPVDSRIHELEDMLSARGPQPRVDRAVREILRPVFSGLQDIDKFPPAFVLGSDSTSRVRQMVEGAETYRDLVDPAVDVFIRGGLWGAVDYVPVFRRTLGDIAETRVDSSQPGSIIQPLRSEYLTGLALFPTTLLLYGATIAALRGENYRLIQELACEAQLDVSAQFGGVAVHRPMIVGASPYYSLRTEEITQALFAHLQGRLTDEMLGAIVSDRLRQRARFPASQYLRETLRGNFDRAGVSAAEYEKLFDQAEVLFSMITVDIKDTGRVHADPWLGAFAQRTDAFDESNSVWSRYLEECERAGGDWLPLQSGLFGGSPDRAQAAAQEVRRLTVDHLMRNR
ncbi:toll/interleukin-1 receptor domain-containing protein (plasmid) [Rhodococcus qingshengii]|uniref:toll/interleukin-1 receptor domain-containing protein n=1 Tax=Rhodococcus qingshengii TaxID=334542 RepID=UPI001E332772|nr:toll/interleukin-1 receptor domain-containing protein [Rhodococcus qingshengii]UGQ55220.1 toll/interleukin-1 receptor domain-containing protein [Rhodococcus qingshengii]